MTLSTKFIIIYFLLITATLLFAIMHYYNIMIAKTINFLFS